MGRKKVTTGLNKEFHMCVDGEAANGHVNEEEYNTVRSRNVSMEMSAYIQGSDLLHAFGWWEGQDLCWSSENQEGRFPITVYA